MHFFMKMYKNNNKHIYIFPFLSNIYSIYLERDDDDDDDDFFQKIDGYFFVQKITQYLYESNFTELKSEKINPKFFIERKLWKKRL